jgi:hypothetical protein
MLNKDHGKTEGEIINSAFKELESMPEKRRVDAVSSFEISIYIFVENYNSLNTFLEQLTSADFATELWSMRNRYKLKKYQYEVVRKLHNFVASAQSLIDHTRNHYNGIFKPSGQISDYQRQIDNAFQNNGLAKFIIGLRHYCQHYKTPNIMAVLHFQPEELGSRIYLNRNDLLQFSKFSSLAKRFIEKGPENIDIMILCKEYFDLVSIFYAWFQDQQMKALSKDIIKVESVKEKVRAILLQNVPLTVRQNWGIDNGPQTIKSIENGFVVVFNAVQWEDLDTVENIPMARCSKIIEILHQMGITDTAFEEELKLKFGSISPNSPQVS